MPDHLWDNLKQIFHAAVALPPGARPTYLDKACKGDLSLRAAVESLIKSHEETVNFVDAPAYQAAAEMLVGNHEFKSGNSTCEATRSRFNVTSIPHGLVVLLWLQSMLDV